VQLQHVVFSGLPETRTADSAMRFGMRCGAPRKRAALHFIGLMVFM
jgi:hypothetical protein